MGNALLVGGELDAVHRPATRWKGIAIATLLLALGLGGTARPDDDNVFESHSFFHSHDASHWDVGWGLQCSLLYDQQWQVHVAYDWGFKNMNDCFLQNNGLSVGLTLYFEY